MLLQTRVRVEGLIADSTLVRKDVCVFVQMLFVTGFVFELCIALLALALRL